MSQNFPHSQGMRGARPKVRGVYRPNEAEQQENLCGPSLDVMQEEVESHLKFYENLINDNFSPTRDRGATANGPPGGSRPWAWRGFRPDNLVNRAEEEECLRPPFSKPNQRGLCAGLPALGVQLPETCATRIQRSCNQLPTGNQVPDPAPGIGLMQPVNPMAWQPRTNNFAEVANIFLRPEDRPRLFMGQAQAARGPNQLQEQPAPPPQANAGAMAQGHSHPGQDGHHGHDAHHGHHGQEAHHGHHGQEAHLGLDVHHGHHGQDAHHGHHGLHGHQAPNLNLDPGSQAPRGPASGGLPQGGDLMEDHHHHHHHHHHQERQPVERDEKTMSALRHLVQFRRSPSYVKCDKKKSLEFLEVCNPKVEGGAKAQNKDFPRIPCLQDNALNDLITCEKQDVESALYLASDERKTYKKPCPKQQKAQMTVKALVHAHAGQPCKEYSPLEHPDPDDISPEVAAAMMFCQEQGIDMVGCPNLAINFLFPEEAKPPFPEKIPPENISVVGPDQRQQEDMIEQSATVSAEGVSDSAYTRTMKEKGEDLGPQKSYDVDFAVGQTKREYVLVAQKPQRVNRAQFRGGASPTWFPGYFAAFPDEDGTLKLVSSPSRLLHRAWVHSKPVNMPQSDIIVVD